MPRNEVEGLLELKSNTGRSCTAHAMGTADSMLHAVRIAAARIRKTPGRSLGLGVSVRRQRIPQPVQSGKARSAFGRARRSILPWRWP